MTVLAVAPLLLCSVWAAAFDHAFHGNVFAGESEGGSGYFIASPVGAFARFFVRDEATGYLLDLSAQLERSRHHLKPRGQCVDKHDVHYWIFDIEKNGVKT